jgi:hypothetical protein
MFSTRGGGGCLLDLQREDQLLEQERSVAVDRSARVVSWNGGSAYALQ